MLTSRLSGVLGSLLVVGVFCSGLMAAVEPTPEPTYRPLRTDHVKTWYIFNDSGGGSPDGVLKPGDTRITTFQNWWTPVSAHTQYNYDRDSMGAVYDKHGDIPADPMSFANKAGGTDNLWLSEVSSEADRMGAINFYMSYSQFDNNNFDTYYAPGGNGYGAVKNDPDLKTLLTQRNRERNGWNLAWVTNGTNWDTSPDVGGNVEMAVYVHNGQSNHLIPNWGYSNSNPQVALSNDIDYSAAQNGQWHPPTFNDDPTVMDYDPASPVNAAYMATLDDAGANFGTIVNSMEVKEVDPLNMPGGMAWLEETPQEILANGPTDHLGNPYEYQDAFADRSSYAVGSNDGGVIAGLAGESLYDPALENWGDQQVIRIDISPETLMMATDNGKIDKIIFYDFGEAAGSSQTTPMEIIFGVDLGRSLQEGQIFYNDPIHGLIYFPDNRIYIAQVDAVPEPATVTLLVLGAAGMLLRSRKRRN